MKTYIVTDTVTYRRTFRVRASSPDAAINKVETGNWSGDPVALLDEEQIDNTPYEAALESEGAAQ